MDVLFRFVVIAVEDDGGTGCKSLSVAKESGSSVRMLVSIVDGRGVG